MCRKAPNEFDTASTAMTRLSNVIGSEIRLFDDALTPSCSRFRFEGEPFQISENRVRREIARSCTAVR